VSSGTGAPSAEGAAGPATAAEPRVARGPLTAHPYIGILGVLLGAMIATLTGRLLSVGLADLRGGLSAGVDEAAWIPTAYNVSLMFMGPFSVYLGVLFGPRRVLLASGCVFTATSLFSPLAPDLTTLLALQVLGGLSSGTFYPLTLSFVLRNLPTKLVLFGIAAYAMDILVATNVAVSLEAWYIARASWRWIFWSATVMTPVMVACVYFGVPRLPPSDRDGPRPSWRGFLYASVGLSLLYAALDQGERLDWFGSGVIAGLFAGGGFLVACAVIRRLAEPNPLVNLRFLWNRDLLIMGGVLVFFRFILLATAYLVPQYLARIQGYSALQTGDVLMWIALPQLVLAPVVAVSQVWIDSRLVLAFGFALVAVACFANAGLTSAWAGDDFLAMQIIQAVGQCAAFVGLVTILILLALRSGALSRPADIATFAAFFQTVRLFGGQLGTVFMQRFTSLREQSHSYTIGLNVEAGHYLTDERLRALTGGLSGGSASSDDAQARAVGILDATVRQQAYTLAFIDGFLIIGWAIVLCLVVLAVLRPVAIPRPGSG
jgi:DHA2 family multidrug resistance protein